jgi:CRP-like cAMP-binding protein
VKEATVLSFKRYEVPFFVAIPEPKMTVLAGLCVLSITEPGFVVARQGEVGDKFVVLAHGNCTVTKTIGETEMEVGRLEPGNYFGEIALVRDSPRMATVTCVTRCVLLSISQEGFDKFFLEAPEALADFEVKLARAEVGLRSVLYHPVGLQNFEAFLKAEFSEENLKFWKKCREYREMKEHKLLLAAAPAEAAQYQRVLTEAARAIYDTYVNEKADLQVNLKAERRKALLARITATEPAATDAPTETWFDECAQEILDLLKTDTYSRFKKGALFASFLEQVSSYDYLDTSQLAEKKTPN